MWGSPCQPVPVPDLTATLRPFLDSVWADRDELVVRVAAEVIARVPTYTSTPSSEVWIGMTRILARVAEGSPFEEPTEADLDAAAGTGIQGARAGIAVEDLMAAVLLGARAVEDEVMRRATAAGVPDGVILDGSRRARRWAEAVAVEAARALRHADAPTDRDTASALMTALRAGDGDRVGALATSLGLDPGAEHVAVVARPLPGHDLDEVDTTRLRFAHPGAPWAAGDGVLHGILSTPPRPVGELVIGIASPATLPELGAAFIEADRVARAAARYLGGGAHDLDSLGLLLALHEDRALRDRLDRRWLEPLRGETRHELVRTLRSWQATGQVDAVARDLCVHANTVRNRLARIDALVPGWRRPQAQAEIWAALVADAAD